MGSQEIKRLPKPFKVYLIQDFAPYLYDPWVVEQTVIAETDRRYHFAGVTLSEEKSVCFQTEAEAYQRIILHLEAQQKRIQDQIAKFKTTLSSIKDNG